MGEFSLTHLLLLAVVVLIFFGPSRLPALGQSLGKAIRGFKQGMHELDAEVKEVKPVVDPHAQIKEAQQNQAGLLEKKAEKETNKS